MWSQNFEWEGCVCVCVCVGGGGGGCNSCRSFPFHSFVWTWCNTTTKVHYLLPRKHCFDLLYLSFLKYLMYFTRLQLLLKIERKNSSPELMGRWQQNLMMAPHLNWSDCNYGNHLLLKVEQMHNIIIFCNEDGTVSSDSVSGNIGCDQTADMQVNHGLCCPYDNKLVALDQVWLAEWLVLPTLDHKVPYSNTAEGNSWLYATSLHRACHYQPSIVSIWLNNFEWHVKYQTIIIKCFFCFFFYFNKRVYKKKFNFSTKTCTQKCLTQALLMSTHKMCFHGEIGEVLTRYPVLSWVICS